MISKHFQTFLNKAQQVHGNRYDYSLVQYVNNRINIQIRCTEHGIFQQRPNNHTNGSNCPACSKLNSLANIPTKLTTTEFVTKSIVVHGTRYDYSLVNYYGSTTKVTIKCIEHGLFQQRPNNHLDGHGCSQCSMSIGESKILLWLQSLGLQFDTQKTFNGLVSSSNYKLKFDFYIPKYRLLIEYDGEHHFGPVQFNGISKKAALWNHNRTIKNDDIKNNYALGNQYQLLRISYLQRKDIECILVSTLNDIQQNTSCSVSSII